MSVTLYMMYVLCAPVINAGSLQPEFSKERKYYVKHVIRSENDVVHKRRNIKAKQAFYIYNLRQQISA